MKSLRQFSKLMHSTALPPFPSAVGLRSLKRAYGGRGTSVIGPNWIRTSEGFRQRIYNPLFLTSQASTLHYLEGVWWCRGLHGAATRGHVRSLCSALRCAESRPAARRAAAPLSESRALQPAGLQCRHTGARLLQRSARLSERPAPRRARLQLGIEGLEPSWFKKPTNFLIVGLYLYFYQTNFLIKIAPVKSLHLYTPCK